MTEGAPVASPAARTAAGRRWPSRWAQTLPLIFFELYLTGTVAVFAFGPIRWQIDDPWALYSYLLLGQLLIAAGYLLGSALPARRGPSGPSAGLLLKASILITLLLLPPTLSTRNFAGVSLLEALRNPVLPFRAKLVADLDYRWLSILRTLASPGLALLVPLGIVFFRRVGVAWRALWGVAVAGRLAVAV